MKIDEELFELEKKYGEFKKKSTLDLDTKDENTLKEEQIKTLEEDI